ncbi:MAG: hypothetical protein NT123_04880, partial [Proteobacteria bacterium]|nr:hypothetical protein [Pseudomonadota bacterium]
TRDNSTCGSCTASFMPALIAASKRKSQYCLSSTSHQGLGTMNDGALGNRTSRNFGAMSPQEMD